MYYFEFIMNKEVYIPLMRNKKKKIVKDLLGCLFETIFDSHLVSDGNVR